MRPAVLLVVSLLLLSLVPTVSIAQDAGVVAVERATGDDDKAVARRLRLMEDRLDVLWSVKSGPDVMHADTVDRLATRLLALEARMATVEQALGIREARASHAHDAGAFQVALALAELDDIDFTATARTLAVTDASRRSFQIVRATAWPRGLQAKSQQLLDAWKRLDIAARAREPAAASSEAAQLDSLRRQLSVAASNWLASMAVSGAHDHSGASAGAHADHSPHHGGQVGMKGDVHLELVSDGGGSWRVYLTDAFRQPHSIEGVTGAVVIEPDDTSPQRIALAPGVANDAAAGSADEHLAGVGKPASRRPVNARVELEGALGPLLMDFQFSEEGDGTAVTVHPPDCPMAPAVEDAPAQESPLRKRLSR